jgi:hypothetical protein
VLGAGRANGTCNACPRRCTSAPLVSNNQHRSLTSLTPGERAAGRLCASCSPAQILCRCRDIARRPSASQLPRVRLHARERRLETFTRSHHSFPLSTGRAGYMKRSRWLCRRRRNALRFFDFTLPPSAMPAASTRHALRYAVRKHVVLYVYMLMFFCRRLLPSRTDTPEQIWRISAARQQWCVDADQEFRCLLPLADPHSHLDKVAARRVSAIGGQPESASCQQLLPQDMMDAARFVTPSLLAGRCVRPISRVVSERLTLSIHMPLFQPEPCWASVVQRLGELK